MNPTHLELYHSIIEQLKSHQRGRTALSTELLAELRHEWEAALKAPSRAREELKITLCILDNAQGTTDEAHDLFFRTLGEVEDAELLIYALSASQKHVVAHSFKTGKMIPFEYFEVLKKLLTHKDPEVKEWTLRTIESLGPLSMRMKKEVRAAKPGMAKLFNRHLQASFQIVEFLEKEWKRMGP